MPKKIFPLLILLLVPLVAFAPLWLNARAMAFDMADYFLPNRYFLGESLHHGIFPWWNPYSGLGIPFHADPQSGAFYPIAWIIGFVFGYDFYSINCEYVLHIVIAGWGMYRLMFSLTKSVTASLCTAICYQLCGVFIGNAQHLTWVVTAAWLPWVIFYWKKIFVEGTLRDAVAAALCLMMMTTGGYPAFIIELIYGAVICSMVFVTLKFRNQQTQSFEKFIRLLFAMLVCYLLVTAPYIVSFMDALPYFTRAQPLKLDASFTQAFTAQSIVSFLFPAATLSNIAYFKSDASMINGYIGLLPLIFLITLFITKQSKKIWWLFFVSCLLLVVSFGSRFFIWNQLFNYVPLINRIRFPSSFRLLAMMGFLITAGMVMNNKDSYRRTIHAAIILLFIIVIAAILSFFDELRLVLPQSFSIEGLQNFYKGSTITNNLLAQSLIQIPMVLLLIFILWGRNNLSQPLFHTLLMLVVILDMTIATRINIPVTVAGKFAADSLNQKLAEQPKGFQLSLDKNLSDVTHEGDGSFAPSYYNNNLFKKQFAYNSYNPFDLTSKDSLDHFKSKMLLLKHPLMFITNNVEAYSGKISDSLLPLREGTVLANPNVAKLFSAKQDSLMKSEIAVQQFQPNKIVVSAFTNETALLTLLQNYYCGWKVTIDGQPVSVIRSNFSTMSVLLSAGNHRVEFEYDPGIIRWLLWMSIGIELLLIIYLLITARRIS